MAKHKSKYPTTLSSRHDSLPLKEKLSIHNISPTSVTPLPLFPVQPTRQIFEENVCQTLGIGLLAVTQPIGTELILP